MPAQTTTGTTGFMTLGSDLPSIACQAAIELDNLLLRRVTELPTVRELSSRLTEELSDLGDLGSARSLVDPSTVVALHLAIQESCIGGPSDEISDLTRQADQIAQRLLAASNDPEGIRSSTEEEIRQLKSFCLILSKRSADAKNAADEPREPHPYRRQG